MTIKNITLYRLLELNKELASNPLYISCAKGDYRLMASMCLFFSLGQQFDFANYALTKAIREDQGATINGEKTKDAQDCARLFSLQQAILAYSACYDTILQIIYFGFHFAKHITTQHQYIDELGRCRWCELRKKTDPATGEEITEEFGIKIWLSKIDTPVAKRLFSDLQNLYGEDKRGRVNSLANTIKHRGGITIASLKKYIPEIKYCTGKKVFGPEIFYPKQINLDDCISMLIEQNQIIYEFATKLYEFMGLKIEDNKSYKEYTLPFDYDNYDTEQTK